MEISEEKQRELQDLFAQVKDKRAGEWGAERWSLSYRQFYEYWQITFKVMEQGESFTEKAVLHDLETTTPKQARAALKKFIAQLDEQMDAGIAEYFGEDDE